MGMIIYAKSVWVSIACNLPKIEIQALRIEVGRILLYFVFGFV